MKSGEYIDKLGGSSAVASICDGITPQAVSQWRKNGIPRAWLRYLKVIKPEVFAVPPAPTSRRKK